MKGKNKRKEWENIPVDDILLCCEDGSVPLDLFERLGLRILMSSNAIEPNGRTGRGVKLFYFFLVLGEKAKTMPGSLTCA